MSSASENRIFLIRPAVYLDRAHGFWLGQIAANLFGLPHEMKYIGEPFGGAQGKPALDIIPFVPDFCDGGRSDDDTDIEWMYLHALEEFGLDISYDQIAEVWKRCIVPGHKIWVANKRARELMDEGIVPPRTSDPELNPASSWNLAGQFTQELWGALCPMMPATAQKLGDKFARVAVSGEAALAAHYVSAMNALAFGEAGLRVSRIINLIVRGMTALPERSQYREVVNDAITWWSRHPSDWRQARAELHRKYFSPHPPPLSHREKGAPAKGWNQNSAVLNGGAFTLGLLYGDGDFDKSVRLTCALGYDADCNAATVGGLLGIMYGAKNLPREWTAPLQDTYRNVTRINLPEEEAISAIALRSQRVAEQIIVANGGNIGNNVYEIVEQQPFVASL